MLIPLSPKDRNSGYLTWEAKHEKEMNLFFKGVDEVQVHFNGLDLGLKKINRKTRRVHLGAAAVAPESATHYKLARKSGQLLVTTKDDSGID